MDDKETKGLKLPFNQKVMPVEQKPIVVLEPKKQEIKPETENLETTFQKMLPGIDIPNETAKQEREKLKAFEYDLQEFPPNLILQQRQKSDDGDIYYGFWFSIN